MIEIAHHTGRPLRVHFVGNTCNNHYLLAKALRRLGVDAHLFYNVGLHFQTHPVADDPSLATNAPDWLHPYSDADVGPRAFWQPRPLLQQAIADCDLIHAEDVSLVWAAQSGKPYVWDPYGYDLNFYSFYPHWRAEWHGAHPDRILAALAFRQAIAGVHAIDLGIWYEPLAHGFALIDALTAPGTFRHDIALAIDTEHFSPGDGPDLATLLQRAGSTIVPKGLTIFHPVRVMFTGESYVNKANDRLIRAVGALNAAGHDVTLVLIERGGPCEPVARRMIDELGITDRVAWIPAMPKHALRDWYRAADVGADEFLGGAMGSVAFESMACGTPLLTYLRTEGAQPTFWSPSLCMPELPPLLNASSDDEIVAALLPLIQDPSRLRAHSQASRTWSERCSSGEAIARKWLDIYAEVLSNAREGRGPRHGYARPLPAASTRSLEEILASFGPNPVLTPEAVLACLDERADDPQLIQALIEMLQRGGAGDLAAAVQQHAAELLPQHFSSSHVAPEAAPALEALATDRLLELASSSLAVGRVGEALMALDLVRARMPHDTTLDDARRSIVGQQHLPVMPAPTAAPIDAGESRPRILILADVPGWIFERHARTLQSMLRDEFEITVGFHGQAFNEDAFDLIYPLEYNLIAPDRIRSPWKYVTGLRSHIAWDGVPVDVLSRYLATHFQRTHVVSKRLYDLFAPHLDDVAYVVHGIDTSLFVPVARNRPVGAPLRVGWAGNRASPAKGFEELIRPLGDIPGVELIMCGFSDEKRPLESMPGFYADLDVYVCSSSSEGHNNALVEAAATGCAIITTDTGTVPEYLTDEVAALIVPRTPDAFRTAVIRLRDDALLRQRLGDAAARAVHPAWSWESRAAEYREFFRAAISGRETAAVSMRRSDDAESSRASVSSALDTLQMAMATGNLDSAKHCARVLIELDPTNADFRALYRELTQAMDLQAA
jgi:glycosyltransferase involved in cell wall biosynthesis